MTDILAEIDSLLWSQAVDRVIGVDGTICCQCYGEVVETSNPWEPHLGSLNPDDEEACDTTEYFEDSFPERCWAGKHCTRRGYGALGLCGPHRGEKLTGSPGPKPVSPIRALANQRAAFTITIIDDLIPSRAWQTR